MAIYKISEVISRLKEMDDDGYVFAEINILEADGDESEAISFEAVEDFDSTNDYETVNSHVILPVESLRKTKS
jgi:hypothetical protein